MIFKKKIKYPLSNIQYPILLALLFLWPPKALAAVELSGVYAFGGVRSLGELISYLVPIAMIVAGIMLAFYFFTGAFDMIISQGDKNAIAAARDKMVHAIIGLLLLVASFVLVRFIPYFFLGQQPFSIF